MTAYALSFIQSSGLKVTGVFVILLSHDDFERDSPDTKSFKQSLLKVSFKKLAVKKFIAELWTAISNQMIKYQLAYTPFDQISDHKYNIHWYGKVFTKLLLQAFNKNNKVMFT